MIKYFVYCLDHLERGDAIFAFNFSKNESEIMNEISCKEFICNHIDCEIGIQSQMGEVHKV